MIIIICFLDKIDNKVQNLDLKIVNYKIEGHNISNKSFFHVMGGDVDFEV